MRAGWCGAIPKIVTENGAPRFSREDRFDLIVATQYFYVEKAFPQSQLDAVSKEPNEKGGARQPKTRPDPENVGGAAGCGVKEGRRGTFDVLAL